MGSRTVFSAGSFRRLSECTAAARTDGSLSLSASFNASSVAGAGSAPSNKAADARPETPEVCENSLHRCDAFAKPRYRRKPNTLAQGKEKRGSRRVHQAQRFALLFGEKVRGGPALPGEYSQQGSFSGGIAPAPTVLWPRRSSLQALRLPSPCVTRWWRSYSSLPQGSPQLPAALRHPYPGASARGDRTVPLAKMPDLMRSLPASWCRDS